MADIETSQSPISVSKIAASEGDANEVPKLAPSEDKSDEVVEDVTESSPVSKQNGVSEQLNGKSDSVEPMEVDEDALLRSPTPPKDSEVVGAIDPSKVIEDEDDLLDDSNGAKSPEEAEKDEDEAEVEQKEDKESEDEDEEEAPAEGAAKPSNGDVIGIDSDSEEEEEPMEVDGKTNGLDEEDKPVSIGSDSESESDFTSQSNSNAPTQDNSDVQEILSDKEDDCVMIDDKEDLSSKSKDIDPLGGLEKGSSTSNSPVSFKIGGTEAKLIREPPSLTMVDVSKIPNTSPSVTISKTSNKTLLPALTDDMFVLEAPSFIVPYIYEKPPEAPLKEVVTQISKEVKALEKENDEDREKREAEMVDKERAKQQLEEDALWEKKKRLQKQREKKKKGNHDEDWEEADTTDEDSDEEGEGVTKVLIKDLEDHMSVIKEHIITPESIREAIIGGAGSKSDSFFDSPLGKFFMGIGVNLVQEHVQMDLLRQQKRKRDKESCPLQSTQIAISSLMKNLETSKENNAPFKFELKRCEFCNFKSESALVMAHHYETPHSRNNVHKCNFCQYESKNVHEILYHMEALHNIKGRVDKPMSYHQCPNCMFEDNGKSKLARHALACAKKFKPETNLLPAVDWDPPAKIPKIKPKHGLVGTATAYQLAAQQQQAQMMAQQQKAAAAAAVAQQRSAAALAAAMRNRGGRPPNSMTSPKSVLRGAMGNNSPNMRNFSYAALTASGFMQGSSNNRNKNTTPSISITPVPRQSSSSSSTSGSSFNPLSVAAATKIPPGVAPGMKPGQNPNATGKTSFVICEICDGYIKDLDQLRNHMQWIHKVKIHPKMIYNRPPLNCQKCQYRFFTDQGLERHLLGSHGLVTSSMQEAANKGKDSGRCPVCGRVYQWKLLNHVSRDHNMTLKPAHLSYKCTVCTATFGMYKQFESHVYSAHSTVAKKTGGTNDRKSSGGGGSSSGGSNSQASLLKPLKINDEITIIPQPSKPIISNTKPIEIE